MIKIPDNVEEWDIGLITKLIHEGYDENEILEFKSEINEPTKKIPITACAFANTNGGTIVLGVNNDRTTNLSLDQRLVGLEDSDDLKSKITNQLKNITSDILLSNVQFKESNIKLLNGRVIVIVKISKSDNAPHQFEYKFYKRLSNGNEPMNVDEIKNKILGVAKSATLASFFIIEGGYMRERFLNMKSMLDRNDVKGTIAISKFLYPSATTHFLYNQAYLYPIEIQTQIFNLVNVIHRILSFRNVTNDLFEDNKHITQILLKKKGFKNADDYVKHQLSNMVSEAIETFNKLEQKLKIKFYIPKRDELSNKS